jgi:hypothetical protein
MSCSENLMRAYCNDGSFETVSISSGNAANKEIE